jgi:lipopolysaccharide/colanic/teichoic acid biosynthesis glycosyltransferase
MEEFLNSWYGIAIILAFDALALVAAIALTYRWFFKRVLDVLVSAVCLLVTSPLFLVVVLQGKNFQKAHGGALPKLMKTEYRVGKKEKVIALRSFQTRDGDGDILGNYGKWLEDSGVYKLPLLLDVFLGKLSFIGVKPLLRSEAEFVEDEVEQDRFLVRAGLIHPLVCVGDKETTYEEMLLEERKYAWRFGLFGDVKIFFAWLLNKIRGEGDGYMGLTREEDYGLYLRRNDMITDEDYTVARELDSQTEE